MDASHVAQAELAEEAPSVMLIVASVRTFDQMFPQHSMPG